MFELPWIAAMTALFLWWFSTGAILLAVRYADITKCYRGVALAFSPLFVLGMIGAYATTDAGRVTSSLLPGTVAAVYLSFLSSLLIWAWIELLFLTGLVTGPNLTKCPEDVPAWERFIRAWGTIAYHELALLTALVVLGSLTLATPNAVAFWTFAVLFFARISAKLNLFLGVPKINIEFLPAPLAHLPSHFRYAKMNWLFPASITALTFAVACWLERIYASVTPADKIGFALLAALTALALLEHWFMFLKLPDEKLWRWMLPAKKAIETPRLNEEAHGL